MLAVFQSVEEVGNIGSVRSARDYYVSLAMGHDAPGSLLRREPAGGAMPPSRLGGGGLRLCQRPHEGTLFWRDKGGGKHMGMEHSGAPPGSTISELMPTYSTAWSTRRAISTLPPLPGGWGEASPGRAGGTGQRGIFPPIRPGCSPISRRPGFIWWRNTAPRTWTAIPGSRWRSKTCWSCAPTSPVSRGMTQAAFPSALRGLGRDSFSVTGRCRTSPGPRPSTARPDLLRPERPAPETGGRPYLCQSCGTFHPGDGELSRRGTRQRAKPGGRTIGSGLPVFGCVTSAGTRRTRCPCSWWGRCHSSPR